MPAATTKRTFHPLTWIPSLYAAESLPFNAVTLVSVMMYKSFGLSDGKIAFYTSWLLLPWTLKPFFSPFLEMFSTKRRLVVATQFLAGAAFGVLAFSIALPFMVQITLAIFMVMAFNSAVHDCVADGLYIDALDEKGQALYVGVQSGAWNIGQVIAQGFFLFIAGYFENEWGVLPAWIVVWGIFGGTMALFGLYHAIVLPHGRSEALVRKTQRSLRAVASGFREVSADFFLKKNVWWLIVFSFAYRAAEGQVEKIAQLFMRSSVDKGGLGMSTADVAFLYGTVGTIGMVAGSLAGGAYAAKVGLKRSLLPIALVYNIPNALFTYLAFSQNQDFWVITVCASVEKFSLGVGFVALTLILMQQLAPGRYSTAHYGFATALMTAGMMVPSMVSGYVSDWLGYDGFFVYILLMGVPSVAIAMIVPVRDRDPALEETGVDLGAYVTLVDGRDGRVTLDSAWAVAKVSASAFLWVVFSGSVYAEGLPLSALIAFLVLAIAGTWLAISGWRSSLAVDREVAREGLGKAHLQNRIARGIAGLSLALWVGSVGYLAKGYLDLEALREPCARSSELGACEVVCALKSDRHACEVVDAQRFATMAADPNDKEIAQAAFSAHVAVLDERCFTGEEIAACLELGTMFEGTNPWQVAQPAPALEDARRYYNKACRLETANGADSSAQSPGCRAAERLKAAMNDQEDAQAAFRSPAAHASEVNLVDDTAAMMGS
jgi:PAT family beta-lactamase induction signal transducer AmpG